MHSSPTVHRRRRALLGAIAVVPLIAAGCGSSNSGSSTGTTASGGTSGGGTITVGGSGPLNNPVFSDPQRKAGIEAAIGGINAAGGIGGKKLKLDWCDTNYNANGELSCARKLAADKVAAVLAPAFLADPSGRAYQVLGKASIPVIGDEGLTPAGLNSPNSFPIAGGIPGWTFGAVGNLVNAGAKKISIFVDPNPSSQFAGQLATAALGAAKMKPAAVVTGDPSSDPALSSAAAKAIRGGVDGVVITLSPQNLPKAVVALRQAGFKGKISTLSALAPDQVVAALKSAAEGLLLSSQLALVSDTGNAGIKKFTADMTKYQSGQPADERSETGWAATQLFAAATKDSTDFSGKAVLAAMNGISTPIDIGVTAPYKVKGVTSMVKGFSRVLNPTVVYGVIKGGKTETTATKGPVNPFTTLASGQ